MRPWRSTIHDIQGTNTLYITSYNEGTVQLGLIRLRNRGQTMLKPSIGKETVFESSILLSLVGISEVETFLSSARPTSFYNRICSQVWDCNIYITLVICNNTHELLVPEGCWSLQESYSWSWSLQHEYELLVASIEVLLKEADPCKRATHERATHGAKVSNTNAKHIFKNIYSTKRHYSADSWKRATHERATHGRGRWTATVLLLQREYELLVASIEVVLKDVSPWKRATRERATHVWCESVEHQYTTHIQKNMYSTKDTLGQLNTSIIQVWRETSLKINC